MMRGGLTLESFRRSADALSRSPMLEATRAIQDTKPSSAAAAHSELDEGVSALIDDLVPEEGTDGFDLTPGAGKGGASQNQGSGAGAPLIDDDLLASVQALLSEVPEGPIGPASRQSAAAATPEAAAEDAGLADELVAQLRAEPAKQAASPEAEAAQIETLDQELAGIADELISSEIGEEPEPEAGPTLNAAVAAAAPKAAPAEPQSRASEAATAPVPQAVAPVPMPALPTVEVKAPGRARTLTRPLLALCDAMSAPLKGRSQHARDVVAWIALCQLFIGVCVWSYVLFIRSPEAPTPTLMPTRATGEGHSESKKDSHAKADPKKDSHAKAEPKKEAAKKPAKAVAAAKSGGH
jgi:hypothetical protein